MLGTSDRAPGTQGGSSGMTDEENVHRGGAGGQSKGSEPGERSGGYGEERGCSEERRVW